MTKRSYEKPVMKRLGLLRQLTKFSLPHKPPPWGGW
jgi:hypothetical protein